MSNTLEERLRVLQTLKQIYHMKIKAIDEEIDEIIKKTVDDI